MVDRVMKAIMAHVQCRSTNPLNERRKLTDVYAEPTTEVIAADHITIPNER